MEDEAVKKLTGLSLVSDDPKIGLAEKLGIEANASAFVAYVAREGKISYDEAKSVILGDVNLARMMFILA